MKEIGKVILSALIASIAGVAFVAAVLFSSNDGADFTFVDLTGFAAFLVNGSVFGASLAFTRWSARKTR